MLPGPVANTADAAASSQPPPQPQASVAVEFSEEERGRFEGERSSGGNGWPRQETLALLKIRSDMEFAFRDATAKGPLWDEVSRKLGELGYHRSGKKCKEKFENVYKYYKRIKEGRTSKADGKTYRFFDQLEALEANLGGPTHPTPPPPAMATSNITTTQLPFSTHPPVTVPSVAIPFGSHQNNVSPISVAAPAVVMPHVGGFPFSHPNISASTNSTSSANSSDNEPPVVRKKRKRKWKDFVGRLMKEVIHKQEELQMKFLDQIEKRERERMAREEAWRMEEMAKMNREHDMLVQERSIAAAKDAAVITFLQKITEQNPNAAVPQILQQQPQNQPPPPQPIQQQQKQQNLQPPPAPAPPPQQHQFQVPALPVVKNVDNSGEVKPNMLSPSPSRWPKAEVYALINLRTTLDMKYQDSGPKGPLWEEISAGMLRLGYNRNAKRCKEKWENINKYYKKVKESSKRRAEDSKTCPYFHQLDAIYREKANNSSHNNPTRFPESTQMEAIMAEPEQQWPLPAVVQQQQQQSTIHQSHENVDHQNNEDDYDDEDEEEEDEGGEYEIVSNKNSLSMGAVRVTEA
ncbi:trihelix transcription factor GT-2-like [Cynara cardunculus var. scolymus]|uniref:Myb-like domain-containing protein n=1 Tax=Cynara cardunculus var. scolymus TaxID=59895 RepID=A0A118K4A0_CYNCS|nr:trihelix transcription factor GT-2-like [Cynara cardunculus var. scolymus]KVI07230.1 Myb-like domain-containing protein [Cynara cardunculus var. scolymus]